MNIEDVARVAHEINAVYCKTLNDNSQVSWDQAPEWQKQSAINGVKFYLDNPGTTPEKSHENWLEEKAKDNWKYGPVKDVDKKEHPCFKPYNELPNEQKVKDYLFTTVVKSLCPFIYKYPIQLTSNFSEKTREATTVNKEGKLETDLSKLSSNKL